MPIGPQLPPHLTRPAPEKEDEEEDDDFGPALPPHLAAQRKEEPKSRDIGPQMPGPVGPTVGPSVGPTRPPGGPSVGSSRPPGSAAPADSDSDDDFVGPRPDAAPVREISAAEAFREREARWAREREEGKKEEKTVKRDEWMLVPPSAGILSSVDATKRPTTFQKNSRVAVSTEDQRAWTETPAERAQRLADEMAGVKRPAGSVEDDRDEKRRRRERDEEIRKGVEAHNKASRGGSLLQQHQKRRTESKEEDEPAFWDHNQHMGVTGRLLTDQERAKKIKDARGLNDRFGHGQKGAYDL